MNTVSPEGVNKCSSKNMAAVTRTGKGPAQIKTLMQTFISSITALVDLIVEKIIDWQDYMSGLKSVTLSEALLFHICAFWWVWLILFDVSGSTSAYRYMYGDKTWAVPMGLAFTAHLIGIFMPNRSIRILAVQGYALIWFGWLIVFMAGEITSTATPTVFVLLCVAIFVAVRVSREGKEIEDDSKPETPAVIK